MVPHRAARLGPWNKPLDLKLHITPDGEPRIAFAHYVQPEPTPSTCVAFHQFPLLPAELQLCIIHFCNSPTLFQLMQTSSITRVEAKKHFWSYPDAWYCVNMAWLRSGGLPGDTLLDVDFPACVEQVDIDTSFHLAFNSWMRPQDRREWGNIMTMEVLQGIEERMRDFWGKLQHLFPRVTGVIVSTKGRGLDPKESLPEVLKKIVQTCPAGIRVSVSLLHGVNETSPLEKSLWRLASNDKSVRGEWEKIGPDWTRLSILLPPKKFCGPVGALQRCDYKSGRYRMQRDAARINLIDAIERHHFCERNEPFACFAPYCETRFESPGEFLQHAIYTGHEDSAVPPDEFMELFDQNRKRLECLSKERVYHALEPITEILDKKGSVGQLDKDQTMIYELEKEVLYYSRYFIKRELFDQLAHDAEQAFLYQLEHDPLYTQVEPATESRWLYSFRSAIGNLWEDKMGAYPDY